MRIAEFTQDSIVLNGVFNWKMKHLRPVDIGMKWLFFPGEEPQGVRAPLRLRLL